MNESNKKLYPSDDAEVVADDNLRSIPTKLKLAKLAYLEVNMMASSSLTSAQRKRLHTVQTKCHVLTWGLGHVNMKLPLSLHLFNLPAKQCEFPVLCFSIKRRDQG
jgi:hypothetical protein